MIAALAAPVACLLLGLGLVLSVARPMGQTLTRFREERGRDATDADMDRLLTPEFTPARRQRFLFGAVLVVVSLLWAALVPAAMVAAR